MVGWITDKIHQFKRKTSSVGGRCGDKGMQKLLIHVEGQTEETFVNEVLAPHLYNLGFISVGARLLGNSRIRVNLPGGRPEAAKFSQVSLASPATGRRVSIDAGLAYACMGR